MGLGRLHCVSDTIGLVYISERGCAMLESACSNYSGIQKHYIVLQEDMYSYVTVADDQQFKGKNTEVVDA